MKLISKRESCLTVIWISVMKWREKEGKLRQLRRGSDKAISNLIYYRKEIVWIKLDINWLLLLMLHSCFLSQYYTDSLGETFVCFPNIHIYTYLYNRMPRKVFISNNHAYNSIIHIINRIIVLIYNYVIHWYSLIKNLWFSISLYMHNHYYAGRRV